MNQRPIIFFDGFCNLCNRWVDWMIRRDSRHPFKFASLQGPSANALLKPAPLSTVVYLDEKGAQHLKSDAILYIGIRLGGLWKLLGILWIIPKPLRDSVYDWVASHRYSWFGKRNSCRVPTPEEKSYFLD